MTCGVVTGVKEREREGERDKRKIGVCLIEGWGEEGRETIWM